MEQLTRHPYCKEYLFAGICDHPLYYSDDDGVSYRSVDLLRRTCKNCLLFQVEPFCVLGSAKEKANTVIFCIPLIWEKREKEKDQLEKIILCSA